MIGVDDITDDVMVSVLKITSAMSSSVSLAGVSISVSPVPEPSSSSRRRKMVKEMV